MMEPIYYNSIFLLKPSRHSLLRSHDAQFPWWRALQAAPDRGRTHGILSRIEGLKMTKWWTVDGS